ncbi:hypothetical protein [Afifella marina]|uniref:DUF3251 domain-containing protein n=1 Tax=Afifella marina DSM 2698 TaxID=1120955 RepID=A0A1G5MWG2_AFIMA|nr:hypothetical protein [Afifella marina]SCZ29525.1 hypothetical protein SAMN03080610_01139 [Afifella marina DSM 2698]
MLRLAIAALVAVPAFAANADPLPTDPVAPDPTRLIDAQVMDDIRTWMNSEVVRLSVRTQNQRYGALEQVKIDQLDEQWKTEREAVDKPLIAATLSNPLSVYLTRMQGQSAGLFVEIFVMDDKGLNVGQSSITGDFWQGDEAKFQETFPKGAGAIFIDAPEFDDTLHIWRAQVNMTLAEEADRTPIGAVTVEVNLTELARRKLAMAK